MVRSVLKTQIAEHAGNFADQFRQHVQGITLGPLAYTPDLTAPDGPSTGGGAQARQNIRLVPKDANHPTIVVGFANHHAGEAEIRTFEYVDAVYRERSHRSVPFDAVGYMRFIESVRAFLEAAGLTVAIAGPPASSGAPSLEPPSTKIPERGPMVVITVVGAILVTAASLLWLMLSARK